MTLTKKQNVPSHRKEKNVKHLQRKCEVYILKRAHTWSQATSTESERSIFEQKYKEFLGTRYPTISDYNKTFDRYVIFASGEDPKSGEIKLKGLISNSDVSSVSVSSNTAGTSTAEVTMKNIFLKYQFKDHPIYKNQCIIEPNDEIIIRLSGLDNKLYTVFKGYINTVSLEDNGLDHIIHLSCEDITKRLRESRTNVRPSLNTKEAEVPAVVFTKPWALKKPHDVIATILARTYGNFNSSSGFTEELSSAEASEDPIQIANVYEKHTEDFLERFEETPVTVGSGENSESVVIPRYIYVFHTAKSGRTAEMSLRGFKEDELDKFKDFDLVAIVSGTSQEAYRIQFINSGWDFWVSEWKSTLSICREITDTLFFEFFMNPFGVIQCRPLNTSIPADVNFGILSTRKTEEGLIVSDVPQSPISQYGRVGSEYWLQDKDIIRTNTNFTDKGIFSIIITRGQYAEANINLFPWNVAVVKDFTKQKRYGPRMANQIVKIGLKTPEACEVWGRSWLERNNKKAFSSSVTMKGDARLQPGNPCYLEKENMVYYIEKISHNFTSGDTYNMTLVLTYGRRPLALTHGGYSDLVASGQYTPEELFQFQDLIIDKALILKGPNGTQELSQLDITRYRAFREILSFHGYVWEDISNLDYTKLLEDKTIFNAIINSGQQVNENTLQTVKTSIGSISTFAR